MRITPNDQPQRRLLHLRHLPHRIRALRRVPSLSPMPLRHIRSGINVVVSRVLLRPEIHRPPRPVRPESAGLDASELDAPLWLQLLLQSFREAFHRPLAGAVDAERRHAALAADGRDLLDAAAGRGVLLAHGLEGCARDVQKAVEIHVHLSPDLLIGQAFEFAREAVAGVVDDDVDAAEVCDGLGEGSLDGRLVGDVAVDSEEIVFGGGWEGEFRGVAGGGDDFVAFFEALFDVVVAEASGGASYKEDLGSHYGGSTMSV